jgi:hypothetical protein
MALLSMDPEPLDDFEPAPPPTHDIVHELTIAATPDAVFDAITTQAGLAAWWDRRCDHALDEGQVSTLPPIAPDGEPIVARVDVVEPTEVVQWECVEGPREWVGTSVAFRIEGRPPSLAPEAADTAPAESPVSVVRFWHGGWAYEDGLLPRASFDWAMLLDSLRRYLETGTGSPR